MILLLDCSKENQKTKLEKNEMLYFGVLFAYTLIKI